MTETPVDEAWNALAKHLGMRCHGSNDDWKYCQGKAEARALALAVWDASYKSSRLPAANRFLERAAIEDLR